MKKKNAINQIAVKQKLLDVGLETGIQQMADFISLVLNDPDVMGKGVFGANRLKKILGAVNDRFGDYRLAFTNHDEADYYRSKLDEQLKRIYGDEAGTFLQRYPSIKEVTY